MMTRVKTTDLRMMNRQETLAAELSQDGNHSIEQIMELTGLNRAQIVAACDLYALWRARAAAVAQLSPVKPTEAAPPKSERPAAAAFLEPAHAAPPTPGTQAPAESADEHGAQASPPPADAPQAPEDSTTAQETQPRAEPAQPARTERGRMDEQVPPCPVAADFPLERLLEQADASTPHGRQLAGQIRTLFEQLRDELENGAAIAAAQADVEAARARLAEAEQALRRLTGDTPPAADTVHEPQNPGAALMDKDLRARIRTWAQSQGRTVGERGRIPDAVVDAYLRAHPQKG